MWIKMLDTYVSGNGSFFKDLKYDLPPDTIKLLPKGCYKKCCAPWDEHKDQVAIDLAAAKTKAGETKQWADIVQDKADKAKTKAEALDAAGEIKDAEVKKAEEFRYTATVKAEMAANAAKKDGASQGDKKQDRKLTAEAERLAMVHDRELLLLRKAGAEYSVVLADYDLLQFDADRALEKAEAAAKAVEDTEAKIAKTKADAKEKANAKIEAEAKAQADAEAKTEADAKAKAEAKAKANAEAEAKARAEAEAKIKADAYAKAKAEAEAQAQVEAEVAAAAEKENTEETAEDGSENEEPEESEEPAAAEQAETKDDTNAE